MTADWGTGLYGAPKIAEQMQQGRRLRAADAPRRRLLLGHEGGSAGALPRRLAAGRRESGPSRSTRTTRCTRAGSATSSWRCRRSGRNRAISRFENTHWLLVVLDTAYVDHDMDNEQVAWLNLVLKQSREANGGSAKKLVLFSHQQLFSRLDNQGPKLQNALRHLLNAQGDHGVVLGPRAPVRHLRRASALRAARPLPRQRRHSRSAGRGK